MAFTVNAHLHLHIFFKEDETTKATNQTSRVEPSHQRFPLDEAARFSATKAYENHAIVKFLESIGARLGYKLVGKEWGNQGLPTMCYLQIMYVHQNGSKWVIATMNRVF